MKGVTLRGWGIRAAVRVAAWTVLVGWIVAGCVRDESPEALIAEAERHRAAGRYEEAAHWYQRAAHQGDAEAQRTLADRYAWGGFKTKQGALVGRIAPDPKAADRWYRRAAASYRAAADTGDVAAQTALADLYFEGRGVPRDDAAGVRLLRAAAEEGHAPAQHRLGAYWWFSVQNDPGEAARWVRRAADQGYAEAMTFLAFLHQYGHGVPRDRRAALRWLRAAAAQGDPDAQIELRLLEEGMQSGDS